MDDPNQSDPPAGHRARGADRRSNTVVSSPPFESKEGTILTERRSPIDRRANWIREFSLDAADNGATKTES
jgi:hypothetical protein